ncbi:MAG: branched-chain amino acid ABC transporter permease [Euzebyales bacterium]|nr:branched-chain amino acid ABC transporter permease [Euzebyales bacterium]MBA3621737.1 branched-chain amino acid ABC transporter permease [Euzebyales bacterium]
MAAATGVYHTTYQADLALRHTRVEWARLALAAGVALTLPFLATPFWLTVLNQIGIAAIGAIGLNILVGFTGQISLGQGGFLAVGAYTSGLLATNLGLPFPLAMAVAVVVTAAVGTLFGLPALRLKGLYLAIATLASQELIIFVVRNWDAVTGGTGALVVAPASLFGVDVRGDFAWYWVILFFAVVATLAATNLFRTGLGRAFVAIRDQDIAAEVIGVDPLRYKLLAFAVSSGFVGLSGALTAHYRSIVTWERFTLEVSILFLAMIIVGGLGSVSGSIYGAIFMIVLPAAIQQLGTALRSQVPVIAGQLPAVQQGAFGLVIILFLIFEPRGLARIWQRCKDYFRLWPFRY